MSDPRFARLEQFARAWSDADTSYHDDIVAAQGDTALLNAIDTNWYHHQKNWADAASAALEIDSAAVEAAHQAAKAANDATAKARKNAEGLAAIIRKSAKAADALLAELKAVAAAG